MLINLNMMCFGCSKEPHSVQSRSGPGPWGILPLFLLMAPCSREIEPSLTLGQIKNKSASGYLFSKRSNKEKYNVEHCKLKEELYCSRLKIICLN